MYCQGTIPVPRFGVLLVRSPQAMQGNHPINIEAMLSHVPLFNGLAPEEIARIARGTREIHAGKGDIRVKGLCVGLCKDDGQGPYCLPP